MHGRQVGGRDAGAGNPGTTGWIAVSRSGAYVPNGSCMHGIGANCDTAGTVIYRTDDAGVHFLCGVEPLRGRVCILR
jgi:hypothetical protein